jgi:hypothetical protein
MLNRKVALVGLTIAVIIITGCVPNVMPEPTATARPTETAAATAAATPTATETPPPATATAFLTIEPLPPDNNTPAPFEGYKSADYEQASQILNQWMEKWAVAGWMGSNLVGGTLPLVPLEGGGVCGLVLSGGYYEEGKDTYLCVPLNTVDGGLASLPPGPIAETDAANHPLFIKLDKGQTLELVGGVYQARNADDSAAWHVNPKDNDKGPAGAKIEGEYKAPPYTVTRLSAEQMAATHGIVGTGLEIDGEYEGVPMKITIALSKTIEDQYGRVRQCKLDLRMGEVDPSLPAGTRVMKEAALGFFMAKTRDIGATEDSYKLSQFLNDVAEKRVTSVQLAGKRLDGSVGVFTTKLGVVEFVGVGSAAQYGDDIVKTRAFLLNGYAYQQLADGVRIVYKIDEHNDDDEFCMVLSMYYSVGVGQMGANLKGLEGDFEISGANLVMFPKTFDLLNKTTFQPYTEYGDLGIFVKP